MSLINDALRRATQQQKEAAARAQAAAPDPAAGALPTGAPLQPVEYPRRSSLWVLLIMTPLILVLLGLGWFFIHAAFNDHSPKPTRVEFIPVAPPPAPVIAPAPVVAPPAAGTPEPSRPANPVAATPAPAVRTAPPVSAPPVSVPAAVAPTPAPTPAPIVAAQASPVAAPAASEPAAPKPLKLQGIYFRLTNPSALINGRSVFVGESVDDARIVAITRLTVVVEQGGRTNVLRLP